MRVIVAGGTGLIGTALVEELTRVGSEIIVLSRDPVLAAQTFHARGLTHVQAVRWDAQTADGWGALVNRDCALVNLAGASPAHWRWTAAYRRRILESRLHAGRAIAEAVERFGPLSVLVQASAAGYYGDRGPESLTELSSPGQGFRADVCRAWEASTADVGSRHCIVRIGFVLDAHAGVFPLLVRFAELLGSRLGSGRQWMPWMHRHDAARAIRFILEQPALSGPFNLCAPDSVTNREFLRGVRRVLNRPPLCPLPACALRVVLGELSTVVLDSQRLLPQRLLQANFPFVYAYLDQALNQLLGGAGRVGRRDAPIR